MTTINNPDVVAELSSRHEEYEKALVTNDVEALKAFFWDSPHAVRFGVGENLYGNSEIDAFRKARPAVNLAREVSRVQVITLGEDTGVVTLEFRRIANDVIRYGRQSQFWRKFPDGWKIISAHVSFLPLTTAEEYVDLTARMIGLPLAPEYRDGVARDLATSAAVASLFLEFPLPEGTEAAPIFQP